MIGANGKVEGAYRSADQAPRPRHVTTSGSRSPPTIVRPPAAYATSSNAVGFLLATSNSVRAAPEGARRPCSQSCRVRTETPISSANCPCDRPVLARILATLGMLVTRPYSPRLSWRRPSRISRPMFRLALDIFRFLSDLPKHVRWNFLRDILRVHRQHPNHPMSSSHVVNDAIATAFTATRRPPSQFTNATRAGDHWSRFGIAHERFLKPGVIVVAQVIEDELGKEARLDKAEHCASVRHCRMPSSGGTVLPGDGLA
jgi:hypothetical protein